MTGYEVARAVRGDSSLCHTVLVAVTGYGQPDDVAQSREAGFDDHVIKPANSRDLNAALERLQA